MTYQKEYSFCKKLQYQILHNKKSAWVKRERRWKFDRIDAIFWVIFLSTFVLAYFFEEMFIFLGILIGSFAGSVEQAKHIKSIPSDIEAKLISSSLCVGILLCILLIGFFIVFERLL